jgi:nitroreductase/dihydropteridine reductase
MDLLQQLQWRYAVRQFDGTRCTSHELIETLVAATHLSPSAAGLQPYRLVLIENRAVLGTLAEHSMMNKDKILSADGLFVLAIYREMSLQAFTTHVSQMVSRGLVPPTPEAEVALRHQRFMARLPTPEAFQAWAHKQAYLALGTLLTSCAVLGVDACPMEGFDMERYDEILQLAQHGLTASVILAFGRRSPADPGQFKSKYRRPLDQFLLHLT